MTKQLKAVWSTEPAMDFCRDFSVSPELNALKPYEFIPKIRWYQFWRWHWIKRPDYILSRAGELVIAHQVADELRKEIDAEILRRQGNTNAR